jgi:ribosome biogenesis GTPase A
MNINWYPGHMVKTRRLIRENLKLVDLVIEVVDSRLPLSSRNPDMDDLLKTKPRLVILNKMDIADDEITKEWVSFYNNNEIPAITVDSLSGKGINNVLSEVNKIISRTKEKRKVNDIIINKILRLMVVGIPNVGKSAFINKLAGRSVAKTGAKPGLTKGKQWIKLKGNYELLDTPGILWPKIDDPETGKKLAFIGTIKDEILDKEELAVALLNFIVDNYPIEFKKRYNLEDTDKYIGFELLEHIGKKRGCIVSGGEVDVLRCAHLVLDDFRNAKIGKISLERP